MASVWTQDQFSTGGPGSGSVRLSAAAAVVTENGLAPAVLEQNSRLLLSPMPASMAEGLSKGTTTTTTTTGSSSTSSSTEAVTLYPTESVPSHLICAICTLPYENPVHFLPCCHVFCLECIQLWIGMSLGDDFLQNELRRAYPADGEVFPDIEMAAYAAYEEYSRTQQQQQQPPQPMFEMTRMGGEPRSATSTMSDTFFDTFSRSTPAQQQQALQQLSQQRVAALLEAREMPKCPMCRSGLHISGWDRIEEQIKVPVTVSQRPRSSENTNGEAARNPSGWLERGGLIQGQRPVSGVERRRGRSNRFPANGASRRRQEVIGEEEEDDDDEEEGIEMEHVRNSRRYRNRPSLLNDRALQQDSLTENDQDEPQSPTTAVIGRRPSEWMRYQQRQRQRMRANAEAARGAETIAEQGETPRADEEPIDDHQEQLRRLHRRQESQEERLRNITARAASFIEAAEQASRREQESGTATTEASAATGESGALDQQNGALDQTNNANEGSQRAQQRQSGLQIDTSVSRISMTAAPVPSNESHEHVDQEGHSHSPESPTSDMESVSSDSDNNSIIDAIQQGTRAWAQRPTSLRLDLGENQGPLVLSLDAEGSQLSASDSFSNSTMTPLGSHTHTPSLPLSPSNESTRSFATSSTFSRSVQSHAPFSASLSRRSSIQHQWDRHSLALQMPTLDASHCGFDENGQPWVDHAIESDDQACCKSAARTQCGDYSSSAVDVETEDHPSCSSKTIKKAISDQEDAAAIFSSSSSAEPSAEKVIAAEGETSTGVDPEANGGSLEASSSNMNIKPGTTNMISPLVHGLDIRTLGLPTATTIADMQIDADVLARARSHSLAFSDDDLPAAARGRDHLDSPTPTPSIARPRRRFPAGISLGSGDDDEEEEELEDDLDVAVEQVAQEPAQNITEEIAAGNAPVSAEPAEQGATATIVPPENTQEEVAPITEIAPQPLEDAAVVSDPQVQEAVVGAVPETLNTPAATTPPAQEETPIIQDPLSTALLASEADPLSASAPAPVPPATEDPSVLEQDQEPLPSQVSTPLVRPQRAATTSPPPLASPLPAPLDQDPMSIQDQAGPTPRDGDNTAGRNEEEPQPADMNMDVIDERILPAPLSLDALSAFPHDQDDQTSSNRSSRTSRGSGNSQRREVREHIQYRTLVKYQPRLPKAHVMSELISQIRVECPHKMFGCAETMEMQQALQHSRDKCQFRLVMCARPRCGQWMRADQIVDHLLMVDPTATSTTTRVGSSNSNSSVSSPTSARSSASSVRSSGRGGFSHRQ
ncbi:hypothetical protein BGX31_009008, partial [Mortierella sp. GBA43]